MPTYAKNPNFETNAHSIVFSTEPKCASIWNFDLLEPEMPLRFLSFQTFLTFSSFLSLFSTRSKHRFSKRVASHFGHTVGFSPIDISRWPILDAKDFNSHDLICRISYANKDVFFGIFFPNYDIFSQNISIKHIKSRGMIELT